MEKVREWRDKLFAVVASSHELRELAPIEIGIEVSGERFGLDLATGRLTDGLAAQAWILGSEEALSHLVSGAITLQRAYITGRIKLAGPPEDLLRVAFLFDILDSKRAAFQGQPGTAFFEGVHD